VTTLLDSSVVQMIDDKLRAQPASGEDE
jgi:hypothetical protein